MEDISDAENNLNVTQSDGESDKDLSAQNVAVAIFGEYIASKLWKLEGTLTDDEMDSAEYKTASVIGTTRKFSQRKQSRYSNSPFLHSGGVPQQTYRHSITGSSSANGPGSLQFNPPLLSNSRLGNIYSNTQVKTTHDNIFIICNIYIFLFAVFPFLNYCIWYIRYMYICIRAISTNLKCNPMESMESMESNIGNIICDIS